MCRFEPIRVSVRFDGRNHASTAVSHGGRADVPDHKDALDTDSVRSSCLATLAASQHVCWGTPVGARVAGLRPSDEKNGVADRRAELGVAIQLLFLFWLVFSCFALLIF